MAQLALCACVGHGAANVVLLGPPWDRSRARLVLLSPLRAPPETGPGLVSLFSLPVPCVPHVPWYFVPCLRYTHITSIAIVYSRFTSIAIHELPKETSHVQL